MPSVLNVDTIADAAGTGPVALTKQSAAKAWVYADAAAALLDSFNIASGTDHGTGDYSYATSNSFSSTNYVQNSTASTTSQGRIATRNAGRSTASVIAVETAQASTLDDTINGTSVHGDLA